ncbi:MAG TPA: amidohydrolase family protein [Pirellulaceae bacterium]|nr:amidohydrolase family protein [Pirellulaceae bacterium]
MMNLRLASLAIMLGLLTTPFSSAQQLAIKAGRVIPIVGDVIEDGIILIRDGKIVEVGKDLAIPIEAKVIDAAGKTVLPGFVDVHNPSGMSQANERNQNVPFLSVIDSIDPSRTYFEESRRNGVTTVAVVPGNSTMIGGQAAVIKTAGRYVDDMILKRHAGIKISLSPSSGASRMSHLASLRKEFEKAQRAIKAADDAPKDKAGDAASKDTNKPADATSATASTTTPTTTSADQQLSAMKALLRGEMSAFVYCANAMDVMQALSLTKQYKLKTTLVLGQECYRAADQIAASKLPIILSDTLVFWKTDPRTGDDEKIVLPKIYHDKKVPVTFLVSESSRPTLGSRYLWYQAATAVKYGVSVDEALRAITLRPAEILGVDKFVGSIEPGKDADLVILSGDPLKLKTWVETTIVGGKIVYEREKDTKLRGLLAPKAE